MNRFVKLFFAMFALCVATTACDSDDDDVVVVSSNKSLTLSVDLEGVDWDDIDKDKYDLRVVAELYSGYGETFVAREVKYITDDSIDELDFTYSVAENDFRTCVWCDFVEAESRTDLAYNASKLNVVSLYNDSTLPSELRRSYYSTENANMISDGGSSFKVDVKECAKEVAGSVTASETGWSYMIVTYNASIPTLFNVATIKPTGYSSSNRSFRITPDAPAAGDFAITDYIIKASGRYSVTVKFYNAGGGLVETQTNIILE